MSRRGGGGQMTGQMRAWRSDLSQSGRCWWAMQYSRQPAWRESLINYSLHHPVTSSRRIARELINSRLTCWRDYLYIRRASHLTSPVLANMSPPRHLHTWRGARRHPEQTDYPLCLNDSLQKKTSRRSTDSERPHHCRHLLNNFVGSRRILSILYTIEKRRVSFESKVLNCSSLLYYFNICPKIMLIGYCQYSVFIIYLVKI